jgi:PleD family two-component response regulator
VRLHRALQDLPDGLVGGRVQVVEALQARLEDALHLFRRQLSASGSQQRVQRLSNDDLVVGVFRRRLPANEGQRQLGSEVHLAVELSGECLT